MRKLFIPLFTILILASCSKDGNNSFEINGRFTHTIPNCDNSGNLEVNCVEFIQFKNNNQVDVMIGGGDIAYETSYIIIDNKVIFEKNPGLNFDISFNIVSETTLNRLENSEVWLKDE